jgi:hypothetical protein
MTKKKSPTMPQHHHPNNDDDYSDDDIVDFIDLSIDQKNDDYNSDDECSCVEKEEEGYDSVDDDDAVDIHTTPPKSGDSNIRFDMLATADFAVDTDEDGFNNLLLLGDDQEEETRRTPSSPESISLFLDLLALATNSQCVSSLTTNNNAVNIGVALDMHNECNAAMFIPPNIDEDQVRTPGLSVFNDWQSKPFASYIVDAIKNKNQDEEEKNMLLMGLDDQRFITNMVNTACARVPQTYILKMIVNTYPSSSSSISSVSSTKSSCMLLFRDHGEGNISAYQLNLSDNPSECLNSYLSSLFDGVDHVVFHGDLAPSCPEAQGLSRSVCELHKLRYLLLAAINPDKHLKELDAHNFGDVTEHELLDDIDEFSTYLHTLTK